MAAFLRGEGPQRVDNSLSLIPKADARGNVCQFLQNSTGGSCHVWSRGRARASASTAPIQPSHALRPGRRRQTFNSPLHFA
jgi:hypothetical protein